jgi:hypothetical protein
VRGWGFGLVCGFFYFVFQNLFGVVFFSLFFKPPVFTPDNCLMSGAPPEDGDADARAILRYMRAWKKRGPIMWQKGEKPLFPFKQLHP